MEKDNQNEIMRELGRGDSRVFRVNTGLGWAGKVIKGPISAVSVGPRDVLIRNARPLRAGLCTGGSDLIGWKSVTITPEMVGRKVAVFLAPEVKSATGKAKTHQEKFLSAVQNAGGIAGVVRSAEEARALCNDF